MENKFIRADDVARELDVSKPYASVLKELQRIEAGKGVDEELLNVIELIAVILGGLKGEDDNGE